MSVPPQQRPGDEHVPVWGRRLTVPCPACTLATHRHRTLTFDGATTYRPQATPDAVRAVTGEEPDAEPAWIALVPGDFPVRYFADTEVFHLSGGIAWPGPHHRDYGTAKVSHDACCPGLHSRRPDTSRGAGELWSAMRLRLARGPRRTP